MQVVVTLRSNRFNEIASKLPAMAGRLSLDAAHRIEIEAKVGMAAVKTGEIYARNGVDHQASAPGEMPAMDTGALANSIQVEKEGATGAVVYTNMEYAAHLEYGTVHMAARPFFTPAAESVRPWFEDVARILGDALP